MFRAFISMILIGAAVAVFVMVINPRLSSIKEIRAQEKELEEALDNARLLKEARDELRDRYNNFNSGDLDRVETLLPDNIDNVKLILELSQVAQRHGLVLQNVAVQDIDEEVLDPSDPFATGPKLYNIASLEFSVEGPYDAFVDFLREVEDSLRLIDVDSISFQSLAIGNRYQFIVNIQTYWLKQ